MSQKNKDYSLSESLEELLSLPKDLIEVASQFQKQKVQNSIVFFGSARIWPEDKAQAHLANIQKMDTQSLNYPQQLQDAQRTVYMSQFYTAAENLAHRLTQWTLQNPEASEHFLVCSGGGPGIMEACNKGASRAGGRSIGLSISIAREQSPNNYVTPDLNFKFDTFMLRKFWFFHFIKALVVFPGGFGTLDEVFEVLTLIATQKIAYPLPFVFFGSKYWNDILNFDALVRYGTISQAELTYFHLSDSVDEAFEYITQSLKQLYIR